MHLRAPGEEPSLSLVLLSMVPLSCWVGRVTDCPCFSGSGSDPALPQGPWAPSCSVLSVLVPGCPLKQHSDTGHLGDMPGRGPLAPLVLRARDHVLPRGQQL